MGLDVAAKDGNEPALFKPIDSVRFNLELHLLRRLKPMGDKTYHNAQAVGNTVKMQSYRGLESYRQQLVISVDPLRLIVYVRGQKRVINSERLSTGSNRRTQVQRQQIAGRIEADGEI